MAILNDGNSTKNILLVNVLFRMARLVRNTDGLYPSKWATEASGLLLAIRSLDEDRYNREVMGEIKKTAPPKEVKSAVGRFGSFECSYYLTSMCDLKKIFELLQFKEVGHRMSDDGLRRVYLGYSPMFDEMDMQEDIPNYQIICHLKEGEVIKLGVERCV